MRNTLKLIIRNLAKNPVSSFINIFGLAVSIALVLILSAYSFSEFFTDKFHNQNIFLVQPGKNWVYVPGILKPTIDNSLADVEKSIRIKEKWDAPVYQFKQNDPVESDLIFSDKEFFDLFTYEALEGNLKTALSEPMSAVISEKLANRLFGHKQAVGKSIKLDNKHYLTVKAVFKNQTSNTTFSFNSIVSLETMKRVDPNQRDLEKWNWSNYQTFLMLNDKTEIKEIQKKIIGLYPKEEQEHIKNLKLLPFQKIYFSGLKDPCNYLKTGNQSKVIYLSIVAILVLFVALVNFMNITSAHWLERIKQTGIMKVVGAKRSIITRNMLLETFILFIVSLILAYFIIFLIAPYLTQNTQIKFNPDLFLSAGYLLLTIGAVILLSVLCGIIPALKIAASQTLANLKKYTSVKRSKPIREGIMVSAQFIVAIVLILFTILIQKQVDFGSNNLGIAQENIVGIQLTEQLSEKKEVLKESLLAHANVNEVIFTQYFPGKSVSGWKF
jgi:ABC-type antimicrobial peptide transport system, permease component